MKIQLIALSFGAVCLIVFLFLSSRQQAALIRGTRILFVADENKQNLTAKATPSGLPESASRWCQPPQLPPLTYRECNETGIVNKIRFHAGLTNGLKMLLLNIIQSYEENRCFFVDESGNPLLIRHRKSQQLASFIKRYFEPIGLDANDPIVVKAKKEGRIQAKNWQHVWHDDKNRRVLGRNNNISSLQYKDLDGHFLKKVMMMRVWRPLQFVRESSCSTLSDMGLSEEFMAFSVRRGDKAIEGFKFTPIDVYIERAERAIARFFEGKAPKIFVATDDCSVLPHFRKIRPQWQFVSSCDATSQIQRGFVLKDMLDWDLETTDAHFFKFFTELHALATAKYYIGVAYTNVAWWAYFMRPNAWSFELIGEDIKGKSTEQVVRTW